MRSFILTILVLVSSSSVFAGEKNALEKNKQLVRRLYEECFNSGRLELLDQLIHADFAGADGRRGPEAFAGTIAPFLRSFPGVHYTVEDLVAERDRVTVRWMWRGTHKGEFRGFPASGREVTNEGMAIFQLRDGKIARSWIQTDRLGFLQAIGVLPADLGAAPRPSSR
jgi:steroid delta-isomerase-like uncharacterized protein